jgi:hypothetical protein
MATARLQTREIPKDQWGGFLDKLSHDHRGDIVSVRFSDPELGYQVEMRQLPLVGVSADLKAGGGPRVEIIVGRTDFDHTAHSVFDPRAIRLEEDMQGEPQVLELEAASGAKTFVILKQEAFGGPGEIVEKQR